MRDADFATAVMKPLETLYPLAIQLARKEITEVQLVTELRRIRNLVSTATIEGICGFLEQHDHPEPSLYYLALVLLQAADVIGDAFGFAFAANTTGSLLMRMDHPEMAAQYFQLAHETFAAAGLKTEAAMSLMHLGGAHVLGGQFDIAADPLERGLALARECRVPWLEAGCLNGLGSVARQCGKRHKALEDYRAALSILDTVPPSSDHNWIATRRDLLGNLAGVLQELNRNAEAKAIVAESISIDREIQDMPALCMDLMILARIDRSLCSYGDAERNLIEALSISRGSGQRRREEQCHTELARLYTDLDKTEAAVRHLSEARQLARELGDRRGEESLLTALADLYARVELRSKRNKAADGIPD